MTHSKPAGDIRNAFDRACARAGVEGVTRYTLRHTFANLCEADDKTRSDIMGHTNTKTTQHHYLKTNMAKQGEALNNLPKLRKNYANANYANSEKASKAAATLESAEGLY